MPSITEFSIKTDRVTVLFIILTILTGIFTFLDYPKQEDPTITIREAVVTTAFPGMSTLRVEDLITRKVEEHIRQIGEVDEIKSDSKTGLSIIHVIVKDSVPDLEPVWQDLRNKMADLASQLPAGTLGPMVNDEFGLTAVATIALWSDGFTMAEMRETARDLRDRLYAVAGVRKVELFGIQDERVYLELKNAKMAQFGISPGIIADTLKRQNIILPGGGVNVDGQNLTIEPTGNFDSVSEIESVFIPIPNTEKTVPLRDLVNIARGYVDPPESPVFFRGKPAIVLGVSVLDGVNSVEFGKALTYRVKTLEQELPIGYVLEYATYQPDLVVSAVEGAVNNLYQTLVIVLVVVVSFLGLRTGLIVGSFVPMAMLMGLIVMSIAGVEFQRMSIAAMIISLGLLVDNGIVVAEDIRTRLDCGQDRFKAAVKAGKMLAVPLLTSSLTTILFFGPVVLMEGSTGEYTMSLGQVLIIVLLSSWFLAMYMTPVVCIWFMKGKTRQEGGDGEEHFDGRVYDFYRSFLNTVLRARLLIVLLMILALGAAGFAFKFVIKEFFPANDRNQFLIYLDLPAGSHVSSTVDAARRLTDWLEDKKENPEITSTITYVGSGGPRFFLSLAPTDPDPHRAFVLANTETSKQVPGMVKKVNAFGLERIPEARTSAKTMWFGPGETGIVEVRLTGSDRAVLGDKAEVLMAALRAIPGTLNINQDWENKVLTVKVIVDQVRARRTGVTSEEVADSLNAFIDGAYITDYREGDTVIPVVIRAVEEERDNIAQLRNINVYSSKTGKNVPLSQIANFEPRWDPSVIKRFNQERTITVEARHQFLKAAQLFAKLRPAIDGLDLPAGYSWEVGGEIESSKESNQKLAKNLPLCLALVVFLLVWQFNSFRRPAIIMLTIPMSFVGGIIGLLVMGAPFGFMAILGFLSLAGIIINNGIVLIDRIDIEQEAGKDAYEAIVSAALARARPIVMTTITTILGLMPLIVWKDPLFFGMANVIAFGLLVGTVLTLVVVPVLYSLLFRVKVPVKATG